MSEKVWKFLLIELETVRVHCQATGCGGIIESPVDTVGQKVRGLRCPFCGVDFDPLHSGRNVLDEFALMVRKLKTHDKTFRFEFVLPDKS